jgi:hypothetical protein
VLCATGYRQRVPFLGEDLQRRLTDEGGNFLLYRQVLPPEAPQLTFAGYNSSYFCPLGAEIAALWTAALLADDVPLPPRDQMRAQLRARLRWMLKRTHGKHARGTNIIPFSIHNIDELLADCGVGVSAMTRVLQWLLPIRPGAYPPVAKRVRERTGQRHRPTRALTRA